MAGLLGLVGLPVELVVLSLGLGLLGGVVAGGVGRLSVPVGVVGVVGVVGDVGDVEGPPTVVVLALVGRTDGVSQLGTENCVGSGVLGSLGGGAVEVGTGPGWKFCSGSIGAAKVWLKVWCAPNIPNPDMFTVHATVTFQ